MPTKTITFKKIRFTNPWKSWGNIYKRNTENLPKMEAAFTQRRAKSIMKKGPKKPKSLYGNIQAYSKRAKKYGKFYWKKGLYSRPGHPPFHHGQRFNIRNQITFGPIGKGSVHIPIHGGAQRNIAYRVGPRYKQQKTSIPVPQLHEYGGNVNFRRRNPIIQTRNPNIRLRRRDGQSGTMRYPARPYMRPSAKEARRSTAAKSGSYKRLTKLFGANGPQGRRTH